MQHFEVDQEICIHRSLGEGTPLGIRGRGAWGVRSALSEQYWDMRDLQS
jgi:hypothetical protein